MATEIRIDLCRNKYDVNWKVIGETDCPYLHVRASVHGKNVMNESGNENVIGSGGVVVAAEFDGQLGSIMAVNYSATAIGKPSHTENETASVSGTLQTNQNVVASGDKFP